MLINQDKDMFLRYELGILTLKAALSTRNFQFPIYATNIPGHQRKPFKDALRRELQEIELIYSTGCISGKFHCDYISSLCEKINKTYSKYLHDGCMRFGIAQKLVNLYLKYLWACKFIEEPPHFPIDGIIRDFTGINYDWTTSNSRAEYENAITALSHQAHLYSLSIWELKNFRRKEQI